MVAQGRKQGYTYRQPNLFIAAISSVHQRSVVTRNVTDFEQSAVPVLNPFIASDAM